MQLMAYPQVFLLSSLNHHASVLKLTVHTAYLEVLVSGTMPEKIPADPMWCKPRLQRTPWYDFFDVEQRATLFQGLWGLTSYMLRRTKIEQDKD